MAEHLAANTQLEPTDDTLLTIALAESLLARGGIDDAHLARSFIRAYRRNPTRGWGETIPALLTVLQRGIAWDNAVQTIFNGQGSATDGAAMRVAPVALLAHTDLEQVSRLARLQARRTHAHPHAVDAAAIQALGVALALHTAVEELNPPGFVAELAAWADTEGLADHLRTVTSLLPSADLEAVTSQLGTSALALQAVPTALASFLISPHSVRQTVEFAIRLGGDTDTIAAMAATLCGALIGEEAIPRREPGGCQRPPPSDSSPTSCSTPQPPLLADLTNPRVLPICLWVRSLFVLSAMRVAGPSAGRFSLDPPI